jgi:hypothetical protein
MTTTAPALAPTTTNDRVLGILSLVLGAASIVTGFQLLFAGAGLVLGIIALRKEQNSRGLAIGGIVTSAITLAGAALAALAVLAFVPLALVAGALNW